MAIKDRLILCTIAVMLIAQSSMAISLPVNIAVNGNVPLNEQQVIAVKQVLQQALMGQIHSSEAYVEIVKAIKAITESPEIRTQGKKVINNVKEYVHIVAQRISLPSTAIIKLRSLLQTMQELILLNIKTFGHRELDAVTTHKIEELKAKFLTHFMPLMAAKEQVYGQDSTDATELYIAHVLLDLIQDALHTVRFPGAIKGTEQDAALLAEPTIEDENQLDDE